MVWVHGIFNARKCAAYLRSIGVELLPSEVGRWLTQEKAHRGERRRVQRTEAYECRACRQRWEVTFKRRGKEPRCPKCGATANQMWLLEVVLGDGRVRDYRKTTGYDGPWSSGDGVPEGRADP